MNTSNSTKNRSLNVPRFCSFLAALTLALLFVSSGASAVTVTGGSGASLSSIAGSPTLVTVVLRGGAKDPNLQVVSVQGSLIVFTTDDGARISYQKTDIASINVQGSVVEKRPALMSSTVALRPEDERIVASAASRVADLFESSKDNQELRIWAAANMGFHGNQKAIDYLNSLANSNNLQTRLDAAQGLYLANQTVPEKLVRDGLDSNNRNIRAQAAFLAGLFKVDAATPELMTMLNDRSAQFSAPAAVALARMGNREIIPSLLDMLGSTSNEKNKAGVAGLLQLAGSDVVDAVAYRIEETDGLERYRLIYILHKLGDPVGRKHLIRVFNEEPTIKPEAALVLAADDYWEAIQYLQGRLKRREDPNPDNQLFRARNAYAILKSEDSSAIHVFQSLLRGDNTHIKSTVLSLITDLADRDLLKLIPPAILNTDPGLSLQACNTAAATASPEFRERLQDLTGSP
jgi:HEAT repeat protein